MPNRKRSLFLLTIAISLSVVVILLWVIGWTYNLIPFIDPTAVNITSVPTLVNSGQPGVQPTPIPLEAAGACCGWGKYTGNPVLGGTYGVIFDVSLLHEDGLFKMWISWRSKKGIGYSESADGIHWSPPVLVLGRNLTTGWESVVNRISVLRQVDGTYHMWYTGQTSSNSYIGYATSSDGKNWIRRSNQPVLKPELPWEQVAVMAPNVLWDDTLHLYRMWYSGGEQNEPNAIGYATSPDGITWTKYPANPIFSPNPGNEWEKYKVTAPQVLHHRDEWYYMFYIGFSDESTAHIGIARSKDGIGAWERLPGNPILQAEGKSWDSDAVYKPYAVWSEGQWYLWYNGRGKDIEQIGLAIHEGEDLGFPQTTITVP